MSQRPVATSTIGREVNDSSEEWVRPTTDGARPNAVRRVSTSTTSEFRVAALNNVAQSWAELIRLVTLLLHAATPVTHAR